MYIQFHWGEKQGTMIYHIFLLHNISNWIAYHWNALYWKHLRLELESSNCCLMFYLSLSLSVKWSSLEGKAACASLTKQWITVHSENMHYCNMYYLEFICESCSWTWGNHLFLGSVALSGGSMSWAGLIESNYKWMSSMFHSVRLTPCVLPPPSTLQKTKQISYKELIPLMKI